VKVVVVVVNLAAAALSSLRHPPKPQPMINALEMMAQPSGKAVQGAVPQIARARRAHRAEQRMCRATGIKRMQ